MQGGRLTHFPRRDCGGKGERGNIGERNERLRGKIVNIAGGHAR